jgi:hypothetical protein
MCTNCPRNLLTRNFKIQASVRINIIIESGKWVIVDAVKETYNFPAGPPPLASVWVGQLILDSGLFLAEVKTRGWEFEEATHSSLNVAAVLLLHLCSRGHALQTLGGGRPAFLSLCERQLWPVDSSLGHQEWERERKKEVQNKYRMPFMRSKFM